MRAMRRISRLAMAVALGGLIFPATRADEVPARHAPTGPALPLPPPAFRGTIGESYASSTPDLARARRAPAGAPNVLVVLTDDVGFGAASTFGGPVPTPNLDRLAARGLIYNRFHTTAMCSPTRAALLTGRNHHAVGNGVVANLTTGFPGYNNIMPKSAASLAEVLRQYGWNTAMFGKHHNAPEDQVSPQGPFDMWPTGLGFEYFYGFMAAETNQFQPGLYRGTSRVTAPPGVMLEQALTDDAIRYLRAQKSVDPDKPVFMYYAAPTAHAPLQAPADWIARFKGKFDAGWDATRSATAAHQQALGLVGAKVPPAPRPDGIPAWASLKPEQRQVAARWMEVFAGMLAFQDAQFGRLLDELERIGQADNTLILFIEGDNGAAFEGGQFGHSNPMGDYANGVKEGDAGALAGIGAAGTAGAVGQYGYGWASAMNTPFALGKQYASQLGGVRNGLVVSWPQRIKARGLRSQFTAVNDVMPTVLEAVGIQPPASVNGVAQQPIDGVSFAYSWDAAQAPEQHQTQYFEMMGNRGIYHQGWWAGTTPVRLPWINNATSGVDPTTYKWELYDLTRDPTQVHDLAAKNPAKLKEMQALFTAEARANGVFPLDDRLTLARFMAAMPRPRARYTYWGAGVSVPAVSAAPLIGLSFTIEAQLILPAKPAEGTVVALGGKFAGWSFHFVDGVPAAVLSASQLPGNQFTVRATRALPPGPVRLSYAFTKQPGQNAPGEVVIKANGEEIGRGPIARSISKLVEHTDSLDIGFDGDTPVVDGPGAQPFNGQIERVDIMPVLFGKPRG